MKTDYTIAGKGAAVNRLSSLRIVQLYSHGVLRGLLALDGRQTVETAVRREEQFRDCDEFRILGSDYSVQTAGHLPGLA